MLPSSSTTSGFTPPAGDYPLFSFFSIFVAAKTVCDLLSLGRLPAVLGVAKFFLSMVGQRCPKDQDHALTNLHPLFQGLSVRLFPLGAFGAFLWPQSMHLASMSSCPRPQKKKKRKRKKERMCAVYKSKEGKGMEGGPAKHAAGPSSS